MVLFNGVPDFSDTFCACSERLSFPLPVPASQLSISAIVACARMSHVLREWYTE